MNYLCPTCNQQATVGIPCQNCTAKSSKSKASKKVERKSWEQDPDLDGLDLPDDDFNYDEFLAKEFGGIPHKATGLPWYWWLTALLLLAAMIYGFVQL